MYRAEIDEEKERDEEENTNLQDDPLLLIRRKRFSCTYSSETLRRIAVIYKWKEMQARQRLRQKKDDLMLLFDWSSFFFFFQIDDTIKKIAKITYPRWFLSLNSINSWLLLIDTLFFDDDVDFIVSTEWPFRCCSYIFIFECLRNINISCRFSIDEHFRWFARLYLIDFFCHVYSNPLGDEGSSQPTQIHY